MLTISGLTYRIGGRALLNEAGAPIPAGGKVGLVGRKRAGKSTLLDLIRGAVQPDAGDIQMPRRHRLGFLAQAAPSGGRMRVALAAVLFAEPDLMLLDEPTNHLDLEAALWLERFLRRYRHSFILVSHDRQLLNAATTTTLHLDNGKLTLYSGGFDAFLRARREAAARQTALAQRQQRERERLQRFIDRFRYKAAKARQAQSRIKALARLEPVALVAEAAPVTLRLPQPA